MGVLFNSRDYHEALCLLGTNPLLLRGKHLAQLQLVGELDHARAAVKYARQVEAVARREEAYRQARDERAARLARLEGRAAAERARAFAGLL
jgi:hypothetical protein